MPHDFRQQLARVNDPALDAAWGAIYREAFPSFVRMRDTARDRSHIHADRLVWIAGRDLPFRIDEKLRECLYPDVLLEYEASADSPGWIERDLALDYLAYGFARPRLHAILFPWVELREAWDRYGPAYIAAGSRSDGGFRLVECTSQDAGRRWTTRSVAVPTHFLTAAVPGTLKIGGTWSQVK